jgi:hypothetical protein
MKTFLLASFILIHSTTSFALGPIMNEKDKEEILRIIDRTCADTWCAGDYEYQFTSFNCNDITATCTLTFKMIDRDAQPGEVNFRNKRCFFKEINSKKKIIYDSELTDEFYDHLNSCVSAREAH